MESEKREAYLISLSEKIYDRLFEWHYHRLTKPEQIFFCIWELESQVNNGGFHQYFFNSGEYTNETVEALKEIGALYTAGILQNACEVFPDSKVPKEIKIRHDLLLAIGKEKEDYLDELDNTFYKYEDNLSELLYEYVQNNRDQIKGAN